MPVLTVREIKTKKSKDLPEKKNLVKLVIREPLSQDQQELLIKCERLFN